MICSVTLNPERQSRVLESARCIGLKEETEAMKGNQKAMEIPIAVVVG